MNLDQAKAVAKCLYGSRGFAAELKTAEGETFRYEIGYKRRGRTGRTLKTVKAASSISFCEAVKALA